MKKVILVVMVLVGLLGLNQSVGYAIVSAKLDFPKSITMDVRGSIYIGDTGSKSILRMASNSSVVKLAVDFAPEGMAVDNNGNIYVAVSAEHRVVRLNFDGTVTTFAGNGGTGYSGDGGLAAKAEVGSPMNVAVSGGSVYITDVENRRLRKVGPDGVIVTVATDLVNQESITVNPQGTVYLALGDKIVEVLSDGRLKAFVGTGVAGFSGDGGLAWNAKISFPHGLTTDAAGNLYFADTGNNRVRRVSPSGVITTIVNLDPAGFTQPWDVAVDSNGYLYVTYPYNKSVRRISPEGNVTTAVGRSTLQPSLPAVDFVAEQVSFQSPLTVKFTATNTGGPVSRYQWEFSSGVVEGESIVTTIDGVLTKVFKQAVTTPVILRGFSADTEEELFGVKNKYISVEVKNTPPPVVTQPPPVATQPSPGTAVLDFTVTNTDGQLNPDQGGFTVRFTLQLTNQPPLRSFKWDFGDGTASKEPHPEHTYSAAGAYTVTVAITTEAGEVITKTKEKFITVTSPVLPLRLEPKIYVSRDSLDFRSDGLTQISIAVMNSGSAPLEITKIMISGPDSLDFSVSPTNLMIEVEKPGPQNNVGKVSIVFAPQTAGEKRAKLFLYHNAPNSPGVVELRGTSVVVKPTPDFNGDGWVNFDDLWPFVDAFGSKAMVSTVKFDLDQDGVIGFGDFFIFANAFGKEIK